MSKNVSVICNKIDLYGWTPKICKTAGYPVILLSAKTGCGIDLLREHLKNYRHIQDGEEGVFLARRRHLNALTAAKLYLQKGEREFFKTKARELLAEYLRLAHERLSEITGKVWTSDELLGEIFSEFCIGK